MKYEEIIGPYEYFQLVSTEEKETIKQLSHKDF